MKLGLIVAIIFLGALLIALLVLLWPSSYGELIGSKLRLGIECFFEQKPPEVISSRLEIKDVSRPPRRP
jgi:hypothetical protein